MSSPRIALTHASSLLAEAVIEALIESGVSPDSVVLLDHPDQEGSRISFAAKHITVQNQYDYDYEGLDAILLLQKDEELYGLLQHADCHVFSHAVDSPSAPAWFDGADDAAALLAEPGIVALAGSELSTIFSVVKPLTTLATIDRVSAVNVLSVAMFGKSAVDELASQTIALLSSREVNDSIFPVPMAFNMAPLEPNPEQEMHLAQMFGNPEMKCSIQNMVVAAFHGLAISVSLEFDADVALSDVTARLGEVSGIRLATQTVSPRTDCREGADMQIFGLVQPQKDAKRLQFWIIADGIRNGLVKNYLNAIQVLPNPVL